MKIYELDYNIFSSWRYAEFCGILILSCYRGKFRKINSFSFHLSEIFIFFLHVLLWDREKKLVKLSISETRSNFWPIQYRYINL